MRGFVFPSLAVTASWVTTASVVVLAALACAGFGRAAARDGSRPSAEPRPSDAFGYAGSDACGACHPKEHASFGRTFHRTMTQRATASTVLARGASFASLDASLDGHAYELRLRGGGSDAVDAFVDGTPHRLILATGSHREQVYWFEGASRRELRIFPFVWSIDDGRFYPRSAAFLQPPGTDRSAHVRWNSNCIACHATAGRPGHDAERDVFATRVADLGIACEACHGPGEGHVRMHASPFERVAGRARGGADPSIVHPLRVPPERRSAVCGQCHAYAVPKDEPRFWKDGYTGAFRPGDALAASRVSVRAVFDPAARELEGASIDADVGSIFWNDGTVRVGGREYDGMVKSACYAGGEHGKPSDRTISCLSCHSMHDAPASGQVSAAGRESCTTCHPGIAASPASRAAHTHHAPGTPGDGCVECHMPRSSYALFRATRSHRIVVPDPAVDERAGRLTVCSECHRRAPAGWAAATLSAWRGIPVAAAATASETIDASERGARPHPSDWARSLLTGDAGARALAAAVVERPTWEAPYLGILLEDPVAAVRIVAARALGPRLRVDPLGPEGDRAAARRALGDPEGWTRADVDAWRAKRDDRPITIAE